jgi:hypothetical protein
MNGLGVEDDDDLVNVRWPESTGAPYHSIGVLALALRGRNVVWPELEGRWNWNCCWSGEAALFSVSRHCDLTDSMDDARVSLKRLTDCRDGEVDLARSGRTALWWSSRRGRGLRSLVVVDVGEDGNGKMFRGPGGVPGTYVSAGYGRCSNSGRLLANCAAVG